jgi:hypothetical protein
VWLSRPADDGSGTFKVLVDGEEREELESGERVAVAVDPGRHAVQLKFAYISSEPLELELADEDEVRLEAKRAFGSGPFDIRYFTRRKSAIAVRVVPG